MLDRRPLSRTPQDGAIWTSASFVWYFAVLDGFQPYTTIVGLHYGDTVGREIQATEEQKQELRRGGTVCNIK